MNLLEILKKKENAPQVLTAINGNPELTALEKHLPHRSARVFLFETDYPLLADEAASELYGEGKWHLDSNGELGDTRVAINCYQEVVNQFKYYLPASASLALALSSEGDLEEADKAYQFAIATAQGMLQGEVPFEVHPTTTVVTSGHVERRQSRTLFNYAELLGLKLGRLDEALLAIEESISLMVPHDRPDDMVRRFMQKAAILTLRNEFESAKTAWEEARNLSEDGISQYGPSYVKDYPGLKIIDQTL